MTSEARSRLLDAMEALSEERAAALVRKDRQSVRDLGLALARCREAFVLVMDCELRRHPMGVES